MFWVLFAKFMYLTIALDHSGVYMYMYVHYNEALDDVTFDLVKDTLYSSAYMYHVYWMDHVPNR